MSLATVTPPLGHSANDVTSLLPKKGSRARPLFDPPIVKRAIVDSFVKLNPRLMMKNPVMFVVEVGAAMTTVLAVARPRHRAQPSARLHLPDHALAVVHGAVRQFRRSHGGRPRQSAGRHAAQDQDRNHRADAW